MTTQSIADIVTGQFATAHNYAQDAVASTDAFLAALNAAAAFTVPTIDLTWTPITEPDALTPAAPVTLDDVIYTAPTAPTALVLDDPVVDAISFGEAAPTTSFPVAPTLDIGVAPTIPEVGAVALPSAPNISIGTVPAIPSVAAVAMPDVPVLDMPDVPTMLSLSIPTFGGVDLHEDWLAKFDDIPTLALVAPTPYSYSVGPEYASALLAALKATLTTRLAGGTGLSPAVEQAIWDRARSRETQTALANEADVQRTSEALGFALPPGVIAAQVRATQQDYYDKLSSLSRDVAIKQAELEQENLKQTIDEGIRLEGQLIDYSYKLEQLTFEAAKTQAENAIQIHNAQVEQYKALLSVYGIYSDAYKTIISAELAKVDVFKALIDAEKAKTDVNRALVEQYKAEIEARMTAVEIYKAQVDGAKTLVEIEGLKISAAGEQIKAFVAQVNAETAKVEIYKAEVGAAKMLVEIEGLKVNAAGEQIKAYVAQVNAETAKVEVYKAGVEAEVSKVQVYKVKADAFAAQAGVQTELARVEIAAYDAKIRAKSLEWDGYKSELEVKKYEFQGVLQKNDQLLTQYKAETEVELAKYNGALKKWEIQTKEYEASQQLMLQAAKINGDNAMHAASVRADAAKAGAQVHAQLAGSAYSMAKVSADIGHRGSLGVSYSYSNKTSTQPAGITQ